MFTCKFANFVHFIQQRCKLIEWNGFILLRRAEFVKCKQFGLYSCQCLHRIFLLFSAEHTKNMSLQPSNCGSNDPRMAIFRHHSLFRSLFVYISQIQSLLKRQSYSSYIQL